MNYKILLLILSVIIPNYAFSNVATPQTNNDAEVSPPGSCCLLIIPDKTVGIEHYKSGALKSITNFYKGVLDGFVTTYYENGSIKTKVLYRNGKREGGSVF
jgi:hypothetical protein